MTSQVLTNVENNFTKGLVTEFTGLNFPENACTACENCEFTLIGDVLRREGINLEVNGATFQTTVPSGGVAQSQYVWDNAGGTGNVKLLVRQVGGTLYIYDISAATDASPVSQNLLTTISMVGFAAVGNAFDITKEFSYASGNGYLFVLHSTMEPVYVIFNPILNTFSSNIIPIQIRDFAGIPEPGVSPSFRPLSLTAEHTYNLINQGWTSGSPWVAEDTTTIISWAFPIGNQTFTVGSSISGISPGQDVLIQYTGPGIPYIVTTGVGVASGTVISYSGTSLVVNIQTLFPGIPSGTIIQDFQISPTNIGFINSWLSAEGNYPSNSDIWWYFKNTSDVFAPATTAANVSYLSGNAPQGHFILNAFQQNRSLISGVPGLTNVQTPTRPTDGAWYSGRIFYTGVNASQVITGDEPFYTWTENIYFSQVITGTADFGLCYQTNDPTSENLFDILPTDGGVITIQNSGGIHKLFAIANGLLVFANNGVWFITGSTGIGFAANDYTITQISTVKILSNKSFVDVVGLPYFWNEEGIYRVVNHQGQFSVEPLTVGTILSFFNEIPLSSKKYARGAYDPTNYVIQWAYKSTQETGVSDRYSMDSLLNFNVYNSAFFPYSISTGNSNYISGVNYITYPYISTVTPLPGFKYPCFTVRGSFTVFGEADEYDTTYVDWGLNNYISSFTTGYRVHGGGYRRFQMPYVYVFSGNLTPTAYNIQAIWDYANTGNSGRWSSLQTVTTFNPNFNNIVRRHRLRGRGLALQIQFTSVDGQPFDIQGWSAYETVNSGV